MATTLFGFQLASRDDPLANVRSVRAWSARLPRNDPVGAVEVIIELLEAAVGASPQPVSTHRTQAILELDRIAIPLQEQLRGQYRTNALSDEVRQRLWQACDGLARWFVHAYHEIAAALLADGDQRKGRVALDGVFARLFHYIGVQTRQGLFRYEQWIPGRWRQLHDAYRDACEQGVAAEAYAPDPARNEQRTPEQEYVQILLLQLLNTGNLSAQQIDWADEWLHGWAPQLRLAMTSLEGAGYWLDLGRGEGLLGRRPQQIAGELLYLDVEPLRAELEALMARLHAQASENPGQGELDEQLGLARQLDRLWQPHAPEQPRRGERRTVGYPVAVAVGWAAITAALATKFATKSRAPPGYHYDDYGRLQPDKEVGKSAAELRRADAAAWHIHDSSDSGFRIRSSTPQASRQRPGALLVLQLEDHPRWQVGIVRRLKRLGAGATELGVEIISRNAALIIPREVGVGESGYSVDGVDIGNKNKSFHALYLPPPPNARANAAPSLVLPPAEFTRGRMLSLLVDGQHHEVCLGAPLERAKDWIWSAIEGSAGHANER